MAIKYFEEFDIDCGFTTKPEGNSLDIRKAMAEEAAKTGGLVVKANLVHGDCICIVDEQALSESPYLEVEDCDGLITDLKNVTLTSTHGDCLPIFVHDPAKHVIGVAHAGWRGTAACVASNLICCMAEEYDCCCDDIYAVIGPGIGACCFESDMDVVDILTEAMPWTEDYISRRSDGKYLIDLKGINCELLEIEGVKAEHIFIDGRCTCCPSGTESFFSYRRDKCSERMLAYIRQ